MDGIGGIEVGGDGVSMVLGNKSVVDEIEHLMDVLEVNHAFLKHFVVFFHEMVGDGSLELKAPTVDILGVAEVTLSDPFMEPKGEGDGISIGGDVGIPVVLSEMIWDVSANLVVHKLSDVGQGP